MSCICAEINHSAWLDPASALETKIYGLGVWHVWGLLHRPSPKGIRKPTGRGETVNHFGLSQLAQLNMSELSAPAAFGEKLGVAKSAYPSIQWSIANRVAMLTPCRPHTLLYVALALSPQVSRPSLPIYRQRVRTSVHEGCSRRPGGRWRLVRVQLVAWAAWRPCTHLLSLLNPGGAHLRLALAACLDDDGGRPPDVSRCQE